jgi:DNA-binding NtrC family response regulator
VLTSNLVLLVEDEAAIQEIVEIALQESGFAVATASCGRQALDMLNKDGASFTALVSDIRLGEGPKGWDVARRARELNQNLPVIYMTGGNAHEWAAQGVPNSLLVPKPFASAQLVTAVSRLVTPVRKD